MPFDFGGVSEVLSFILVVVAVVGAAYGALNREALKTLRENNKDLSDRITILEATEVRQAADLVRLHAENDTLRTVVTGEIKLAAIESLLTNHHQYAERAWERAHDELTAIRRSIERSP